MVVFQTLMARDSSKEPQVFNDKRFLGNTKQYFDLDANELKLKQNFVKSDLDPQFLLCNRKFSIYYLLSQLCDHNSSNINQKKKKKQQVTKYVSATIKAIKTEDNDMVT